MKKLALMVLLAALTTIKVNAQTLHTGYQYLLSTGSNTAFKYSKKYEESGNIYTTIYKIYHPTTGKHFITVTATHDKSKKEIVVNVEYAGGGIFSDINKETVTYETPSMKTFGFRGSIGALGGENVPNQCTIKFVSTKYENVKVREILGTHDNDFEFFLLDE